MFSLRALSRPGLRWFQRRFQNSAKIRHLVVETIEEFNPIVVVSDGQTPPISLHVTSRMEHQRAEGLFSKEPDTIAWLKQLKKDDLFLDIGANIGVYTLYAAVCQQAKVIAFEPESQNFAALNRNLHCNNLQQQVVAYPLAASDVFSLTELHLSQFATGQSHHSAHAPIGEGGVTYAPVFAQGTVAMTCDAAIASLSPNLAPRFVKIDVDGNEGRVVGGMGDLLVNPGVEQVLIELSDGDPAIIAIMEAAGFETQPPHASYAGRGNYIFVRRLGQS
jgi:FkbM family methyltransferase